MPFIKFDPLEPTNICRHPEHNPPGHIVLQPGMYTWKCPGCGKEVTFVVPERGRLSTNRVYDHQRQLNKLQMKVNPECTKDIENI